MPDSLDEEQALGRQQEKEAEALQHPIAPKPRKQIKGDPSKDYPSVAEGLLALEKKALEIIQDEDIASNQRLIHLREYSKEMKIMTRDTELRHIIYEAKRNLAGVVQSVGDRPLNLRPTPWLLDQILMPRCLNLLIAPPKCGKTSFIVGLIGMWSSGSSTFISQRFMEACPPVLFVGTDQPESDWGKMLLEFGLLREDNRLKKPPIVDLFHAGSPLFLDEEGIEKIADFAAKYPGLLIVIDSLAAVSRPLGIDENSAEVADPVMAVLEAVEPFQATLILIHHSGKGRIEDRPSLASRGNTALPACASQTIGLSQLTPPTQGSPPDRRILLKTEGRGGMPIELLIERTPQGWICHGDAESVHRLRSLQEIEDKLNDRQRDVLDDVRERWEVKQQPSDAMDLASRRELGERNIRQTLDQLARKGLLSYQLQITGNARRKVFSPIKENQMPMSAEPSEPSEPSEPHQQWDRIDRRDRSPAQRQGMLIDASSQVVDEPSWPKRQASKNRQKQTVLAEQINLPMPPT